MKLLIQRYQFIGITLSKHHLVCTFYDKQINAKKYGWKFGSVQVLLVGDCISAVYLVNSLGKLSYDFDRKQIFLHYDDVILTIIPKSFIPAFLSFPNGFSKHNFLFDTNAYIKPNNYKFLY